MDAEDRWAQQKEWDEEKRRGFDVEIKIIRNIKDTGETCHARKCQQPAVWEYEVGLVESAGGAKIPLCEDHNDEDTAFELYNEDRQ